MSPSSHLDGGQDGGNYRWQFAQDLAPPFQKSSRDLVSILGVPAKSARRVFDHAIKREFSLCVGSNAVSSLKAGKDLSPYPASAPRHHPRYGAVTDALKGMRESACSQSLARTSGFVLSQFSTKLPHVIGSCNLSQAPAEAADRLA